MPILPPLANFGSEDDRQGVILALFLNDKNLIKMQKIADSLTQLVGHTPLVALNRYASKEQLLGKIVAKVESFNPAGSAKDRVGLAMIEDAEKSGQLEKGATIIEPTSGNTGVGLACFAAIKGYRLILTMPETMSMERRLLLKAYGAQVVLTPGDEGMAGSIKKAVQLHEQIPGSIIAGQFDNPSNPRVHELTTGEEIWEDTDGRVDVFVAGVGTGGTISGVAAALKRHNPKVEIVAVEPDTSNVLSGGKAGAHGLQGIGAGFIPANYHANLVDRVLTSNLEEAKVAARLLARTEGILCGISSGAALAAAVRLAKEKVYKDKLIVVLLPDTGERYLSTGLFD